MLKTLRAVFTLCLYVLRHEALSVKNYYATNGVHLQRGMFVKSKVFFIRVDSPYLFRSSSSDKIHAPILKA